VITSPPALYELGTASMEKLRRLPGWWHVYRAAGACMGEDTLRPTMAISKEIDLRFVFGYTPLEFRDALYMLATASWTARR
jgi:hypothetical protein